MLEKTKALFESMTLTELTDHLKSIGIEFVENKECLTKEENKESVSMENIDLKHVAEKLKNLQNEQNKQEEEELLEFQKQCYNETKSNKNMMSYWLSRVIDHGLLIPETIIMQLNLEQYIWLRSDDYSKEDIKRFSDTITAYLEENKFKTDRELFIKTGNFSNKFVFSFCKLTDLKNIGKQYLSVFYGAMLVGCDDSSEVVVREYIKPEHNRGTIYYGMPLNTEFRVFYDFDNRKVLGCLNYWDRKVMQNNLQNNFKNNDDLLSFNNAIDEIEAEFTEDKQIVINMVSKGMDSVLLDGKWSIDIMKCGNNYYLIDMGIAEQSYYYDLLEKGKCI